MIQTIDIQNVQLYDEAEDKYAKKPIPLTVKLFSYYKQRGYREADIARFTNQSHQNVNSFKWNNLEELAVVCDMSDSLISNELKGIAHASFKNAKTIITHAKKKQKVSFKDSMVGGGIAWDKYLDASGKTPPAPTQVQIDINIADLGKRQKELEARLVDVPE